MVKLGMYYESIINYDMMLKYFLMAFNNGFIEISYNIGKYYEIIKKYEEMKKYYKISIKNEHIVSMHYLVKYYQDIEKNYDEIKVCYLMAIKCGCLESM